MPSGGTARATAYSGPGFPLETLRHIVLSENAVSRRRPPDIPPPRGPPRPGSAPSQGDTAMSAMIVARPDPELSRRSRRLTGRAKSSRDPDPDASDSRHVVEVVAPSPDGD